MNELALVEKSPDRIIADGEPNSWRLNGLARIHNLRPVTGTLVVNPDGSWAVLLAAFTFAAQVDVLFKATGGAEFMGPAFVAYAGMGAEVNTQTRLIGNGPLLMVNPTPSPFIPDQYGQWPEETPELGEDLLDAEVVGE